MNERYNPTVHAIEVIMQIERGWKVLPKRTYRQARETIADALRDAFRAGVVSAKAQPTENGGVA